MKEKSNTSRLDTGHEHGQKSKHEHDKNSASQTARPRFKIKFTDYAIENFTSAFLVKDKVKERAITPFDVSKNTALKGLKLCQYRKGLKKYFVLFYWFNKNSWPITIGEFRLGIFGTKQCEKKVYEIVKDHTNDKGIWIKDPKQTIKDKETKIVKAIIVESQKLTINQVIERYVGAGFPRKKGKTKRGASIKRDC